MATDGFAVSTGALTASAGDWDEQATAVAQSSTLVSTATTSGVAAGALSGVTAYLSAWSSVASTISTNASNVSSNLNSVADAYLGCDEAVVTDLDGVA